MRGIYGGGGRSCCPLIIQFITSRSLIAHVKTAGDPKHVVALVGLVMMTADPIGYLNGIIFEGKENFAHGLLH